RFGNWVENARDWNVSRSRYWGAPLPVWRSEDGDSLEFIGSIAEIKDKTRGKARYFTMRHAESVSNVPDVISSKPNTDDGLTELGKKQARDAAENLKKENPEIKHIYVSDMTRAKETAEIV